MSRRRDGFAVLRPVSRAVPSSRTIRDDSRLPDALVVTPVVVVPAAEPVPDDGVPPLLTAVPKCERCGAPHPDHVTHFGPSTPALLLCFLCGHHQTHQASSSATIPSSSVSGSSSASQSSSCVFTLPLRWPPSLDSSPHTPSYRVPARACPPLWFLVLDGSCHERSYWQAVTQVLSEILQPANDNSADTTAPPEHVHVSILLAYTTTSGTNDDNNAHHTTHTPNNTPNNNPNNNPNNTHNVLAVWQLDSPYPHVQHRSSAEPDADDLLRHLAHSPVPLDGAHVPHVHAALRTLLDYVPSTPDARFPLAWTVRAVQATLDEYGHAAGLRENHNHHDNHHHHNNHHDTTRLPYAGAKLTVLLGSRPTGISQRVRKHDNSVGLGGVGGRIGNSPGQRFPTPQPQRGNHQPDLTPSALQEYYQPTTPSVEVEYSALGRACARVAMGVDVLCLVTEPSQSKADTSPHTFVPPTDFGIALWSSLTDTSGAPGPLLLDVTTEIGRERLQREIQARVPWNPALVFGGELRLRLPAGYAVDETVTASPTATNDHPDDTDGPQLAAVFYKAGLSGPASAVQPQLWKLGTADPYTTLAIDLKLEKETIPDRLHVPGLGEVSLPPTLQTCFAYTRIVHHAPTNQYETRREIRIASIRLPLARTVEALYDNLDPEALAVVLFHKLALAGLQDGVAEIPVVASAWLQSLLASAYRSAVEQDRLETELHEQGLEPDGKFHAMQRLLDRGGDFSSDDVLLAQGHRRLRTVPLMTYLLLQSDALRASGSPSLDQRMAALLQMASMPPEVLTRCIAPRIQLWASGAEDDEPLVDVLELRSEDIQMAVMEQSQTQRELILLIDTPDQTTVLDARYVNTHVKDGTAKPLVVGRGLRHAIAETAVSYRTPPTIVYELDQTSTGGERTFARLLDALVEDAPSPDGHENYDGWKRDVAAAVLEELEKDEFD